MLSRVSGRERADKYLGWLLDIGVEPVGVETSWLGVSEHVLSYSPALGDAFALSTAEELDEHLFVGADDGYDEVTEVRIVRFRDEPA